MAAALVVLVVQLLTGMLSGRYPFGQYTRNVNDMWNQFIPFHLQLRSVLRGESTGDLFFNWSAGGGTSFWPDFGTYLSSPLAPLVMAFPATEMETALWLITALKMALAAACMAWLLGSLHDGPGWGLTLLGASYGLCGWAMDDASYVPMWLDGLVALPLIALVALWTVQRRRFVVGALVIGVAWWANYYTAYMASLGAATFLLALILIRRMSGREAAGAVARFAAQGVLGVALSAVLLVPTFLAVLAATPGTSTTFQKVPVTFFAERLLSGTEGVGRSPSLAVGMLALVLALGLPWLSSIARRTRIVLAAVALAVMVSLNVRQTHLVWHLFSSPNGSQFRQAFVVCFWLIVLAWFAVSARWSRRAVLGAAGGLAVVVALAALGSGGFATRWTWAMAAVAGVALGLTFLALGQEDTTGRRRVVLGRVAVGLALGALVADLTGTFLVTQAGQDVILSRPDKASTKTSVESLPSLTESPWPRFRRMPLAFGNLNSGMLTGLEGLDYYSSLTPRSLSAAAKQLGWPYLAQGRSYSAPVDPSSWALMSVDPIVGNGKAYPQPFALPMVRALPTAPRGDGTVWENRESLLGWDVYTVNAATISVDGAPFTPLTAATDIPGGSDVRVRTSCADTGRVPQLWVTSATSVQVTDNGGGMPRFLTGDTTVQATRGVDVEFTLSAERPYSLPSDAVACATLKAPDTVPAVAPETLDIHGGRIEARFAQPVTGYISVATFAQPGWECRTEHGPASPLGETGLLTVRAESATELSCGFTPRGWGLGLASSAGAAVILAGLALWGALRRRRVQPAVGQGEGGHGVGDGDGGDAADQGGVGLGETEELDEGDRSDGGERQVGQHP